LIKSGQRSPPRRSSIPKTGSSPKLFRSVFSIEAKSKGIQELLTLGGVKFVGKMSKSQNHAEHITDGRVQSALYTVGEDEFNDNKIVLDEGLNSQFRPNNTLHARNGRSSEEIQTRASHNPWLFDRDSQDILRDQALFKKHVEEREKEKNTCTCSLLGCWKPFF